MENRFCIYCGTPKGTTVTAAPEQTQEAHLWICSVCMAGNPFEDAFCTHCGETRVCYECGKSMGKGEKYCPHCGIEAGKWKCLNCGGLQNGKNKFCELCGTKWYPPWEK